MVIRMNKKLYLKQYYLLHKKVILNRVKKYYEMNRDRFLLYHKEYYLKNYRIITLKNSLYAKKHLQEHTISCKKYSQSHKKERRVYFKKYRQILHNKLTNNLRKRVWDALKNNIKSTNTLKLLGCSVEFLKQYLEKQFKQGMSWNNYGKWHIDHIKPCAKFDLSKSKEQRECFHYTNLQPLWAKENCSKNDRYGV